MNQPLAASQIKRLKSLNLRIHKLQTPSRPAQTLQIGDFSHKFAGCTLFSTVYGFAFLLLALNTWGKSVARRVLRTSGGPLSQIRRAVAC
jgi:hypothetical protein